MHFLHLAVAFLNSMIPSSKLLKPKRDLGNPACVTSPEKTWDRHLELNRLEGPLPCGVCAKGSDRMESLDTQCPIIWRVSHQSVQRNLHICCPRCSEQRIIFMYSKWQALAHDPQIIRPVINHNIHLPTYFFLVLNIFSMKSSLEDLDFN